MMVLMVLMAEKGACHGLPNLVLDRSGKIGWNSTLMFG
ncbi:hypothetical protein BOA8489_02381 [Boseongicola aestuarii]|uniref:Uncharacterized protein n=1 Tax=Boseongicola aestuarii TaxID=1470561 RepID=A0A238J0M0_9RHOB|nr:hypothetical protein BOA8489_02381 [Boseongicola aestuarii]